MIKPDRIIEYEKKMGAHNGHGGARGTRYRYMGELHDTFGKMFRDIRERRRLKQSELARALGISQQLISGIENDRVRSVVPSGLICGFADILGIKKILLYRKSIAHHEQILLDVSTWEQRVLAELLGCLWDEFAEHPEKCEKTFDVLLELYREIMSRSPDPQNDSDPSGPGEIE